MDPIFIGILAGKIFFRLWARSAYEDAFEDQHNARQGYEDSRRMALQEQQIYIARCNDLVENRKAVLDGRWSQMHTFLVACGVNGGLFAPPRRVFGKRSEEDIRSIISSVQLLVLGSSNSSMGAVRLVTNSTVLIQGFLWLESSGGVDVPVLHESLHDAIISLSPESGDRLVDTMGSFGDVHVGDFLGGALDVLSFAVSGAIFASAGECTAKATQLREEAQKLDDKRAKLEAANQRIPILLAELNAASYELFKWTVVGEEAARLRRAVYGRKRNVSDLPRWILSGLLHKAMELWSSLEKPVFC
jgi:hypothetical protein